MTTKSVFIVEDSGIKTKVFDTKVYKKELSKLISKANKRIVRLQKNQLTDSPAYQRLIKDGVTKFSVKNKSFNELQQEMSKVNRFLSSETSTIRGINKNLKTIASNTGIKYKNIKELKSKASKFFELSSKVEQYLRTVEDMASAVGYNQIWEVISEYTQEKRINLADAEVNIEDLVENVSKVLANVKSQSNMYELDNDWVFLN